MGLRIKTLLVVGITVAGLLALLFVTVRPTLLWEFEQLERTAAAGDAVRAANALNDDVRQLDRIASDLAPRDDTYRFMRDRDPAFVESSLAEESLVSLGVNALLLLDQSGGLVRADFIDLDLGVRSTVDTDVVRAVLAARSLRRPQDPRGNVYGLLAGPRWPMLVAARSVTSSDMYSPPNGTLVLIRYLDQIEEERLAAVTGLSIASFPVHDRPLPEDVRRARTALEQTGTVWVQPLSSDRLGAYAEIAGIDGAPAIILRADLPRDIYWQGRSAGFDLGVSLVILGMAATASVFFVIDRGVLARLSTLSRQVARIGATSDASARVTLRGADELSELAGGVNGMLSALESSEGEVRRARDELERRVEERTERLGASEARYRLLIERMADAVFSVDLEGAIAFVNERAAELTGLPADRLEGVPFRDLLTPSSVQEYDRVMRVEVDPSDTFELEARLARNGGRDAPFVELRGAWLVNDAGVLSGAQWIVRDIAERKRFEDQLVHMASHDHLTGLYNRRFFESALERELAEVRRKGGVGAVLWLDVDDFKDVNDSLGHRAGDEVLVEIAEQLRKQVRESNVLCRLGGDEFAVLLSDVDRTEAEAAAARVLTAINSHTFYVDSHAVRVTASIGLVAYPEQGSTGEDLLANADVAMYLAKESGRSRVHVHQSDENSREDVRSRFEWSERIAAALREDRFLVYAQPVTDLRSGSVHRLELLIRMLGDGDEIIPPAEFLAAAERLGLVRDIDRWMVRQAVDVLGRNRDNGLELEVNLSGKAFGDPELLSRVESSLRAARVRPARLGFEITETAAIADITRAKAFTSTLQELGCRFSLDDFGSGFSSFYYLKHLPIDCLKIDGSFIRGLSHSDEDRHLVRGMVELCRGLGIEVAAEYVEDEVTLGLVKELGMDYAQGYHLGRPVPIAEAMKALHLGENGSS